VQEQVAAREETSEPRYKMKIEKDVDIPSGMAPNSRPTSFGRMVTGIFPY